jgi:uncharacterized RmlC-like cupin family protein
VKASDRCRLVRPGDRVEADPTPGMTREEAIRVEGLWAGVVRTPGGGSSGWHHHGSHETSIYVTEGRLLMESGPGGRDVVEAVAGDFVHVPAHAVHRETNPDPDESRLVVVRAGQGPPTVNVEGPAELD